jgi:radical SAM superfamily enzyme YgiQ (UPF0313 family)
MRILLVYPEFPDTFWGFRHALKFISKKASFPPLGLLTVAAMLPAEWEKRLIDMNVNQLKDKDIKWADYVFISAMSIQKKSVSSVISRCKKFGVKIVAGGPLFTAWFDEFDNVDYLVLNEAEITMPLFLEDLAKGQARHIYTSTGWADIKTTPVPLWELIDMSKYASMNIQFSRGCPFNCEFCDIIQLYGRIPRLKSKEQIILELEAIYRTGWKGSIFFVDDNFIGNRNMLKQEILPALIEWMKEKSHPFTFFTEASINLSDDDELVDMMVEAGFNTVFVGIESPNDESLAECNKYQNKGRNLLDCIKKLQRSGLEVQGGFILGFDNDPDSIFETLIKFIQESGVITAMVGLLNAPRGTKLHQRLEKEGRLINGMSGNNTDFSINFIPKMNQKSLIEGYKKVLGTIYAPRQYYERIMRFFKEFKPLKRRRLADINLCSFVALFKSMFRLGIVESERVYYWRLFFWSLFRCPRFFPKAIAYAIYGYHFRKVFEAQVQFE